jgi:hypothetical protein
MAGLWDNDSGEPSGLVGSGDSLWPRLAQLPLVVAEVYPTSWRNSGTRCSTTCSQLGVRVGNSNLLPDTWPDNDREEK